MAERNMDLQVTIQDGQLWVADGSHSVQLDPETKRAPVLQSR